MRQPTRPPGRPDRITEGRAGHPRRAARAAAWLAACAALGLAASAQVNAPGGPLTLPAALTTLGQSVVVDWRKGLVVATGRARLPANLSQAQAEVRGTQAARADALRLLAFAVDALPADTDTTVGQCRARSRALSRSLDVIVRGATPVAGSEGLERAPDGTRVASAAMAVAIDGRSGVSAAVIAEWAACSDGAGTGLVVDARGLGFQPCLGPRLLASDGTPFWDASAVIGSRPELSATALLASSLEDATARRDRVGERPVVARASAAAGQAHCDLAFDAAALKALRPERLERALGEGRVLIVP
jgi:hypothetical protein